MAELPKFEVNESSEAPYEITRAQAKACVDAWKVAGPLLEAERERSIRATDTARALEILDDVFKELISRHEPTLHLNHS